MNCIEVLETDQELINFVLIQLIVKNFVVQINVDQKFWDQELPELRHDFYNVLTLERNKQLLVFLRTMPLDMLVEFIYSLVQVEDGVKCVLNFSRSFLF